MEKAARKQKPDMTAQIARSLRDAVLSGELTADDRLHPNRTWQNGSKSPARRCVKALKRLAAQSLSIRNDGDNLVTLIAQPRLNDRSASIVIVNNKDRKRLVTHTFILRMRTYCAVQ